MKGILDNAPLRPLHRHRLLRRGDARIQLQGAPGSRCRGFRHAGGGSASSQFSEVLDAARSCTLATRRLTPALSNGSNGTYVLLPAVFIKFTEDPSDCTGWRLFVAASQMRSRHHHRTRLPPRLPTPRPLADRPALHPPRQLAIQSVHRIKPDGPDADS